MKCSKTGIDLIKGFEGLRLTAYLCSAGVPTIGYGATYYADGSKVKLGHAINQAQADDLLKMHIVQFETQTAALVKGIALNQNQFDALVSFAFNLSAGALAMSTLLKKIKLDTSDPIIAAEFGKWVMAGGQRSTGLVRRRKKEAELYFKKVV